MARFYSCRFRPLCVSATRDNHTRTHTMVKKLKQMADKQSNSGARLLDGALAGQVKDSAQQIWLLII